MHCSQWCRDWNRDWGLYAPIQTRSTTFTRNFSFRVVGSENTTQNQGFNSHYKIFCRFMVSVCVVLGLICFWHPTIWPIYKLQIRAQTQSRVGNSLLQQTICFRICKWTPYKFSVIVCSYTITLRLHGAQWRSQNEYFIMWYCSCNKTN